MIPIKDNEENGYSFKKDKNQTKSHRNWQV